MTFKAQTELPNIGKTMSKNCCADFTLHRKNSIVDNVYPAATARDSGSEGRASWFQSTNAAFPLKVSLEAGTASLHSSSSPGGANQGTTDESCSELATRAHWLAMATLRTSASSG